MAQGLLVRMACRVLCVCIVLVSRRAGNTTSKHQRSWSIATCVLCLYYKRVPSWACAHVCVGLASLQRVLCVTRVTWLQRAALSTVTYAKHAAAALRVLHAALHKKDGWVGWATLGIASGDESAAHRAVLRLTQHSAPDVCGSWYSAMRSVSSIAVLV